MHDTPITEEQAWQGTSKLSAQGIKPLTNSTRERGVSFRIDWSNIEWVLYPQVEDHETTLA